MQERRSQASKRPRKSIKNPDFETPDEDTPDGLKPTDEGHEMTRGDGRGGCQEGCSLF